MDVTSREVRYAVAGLPRGIAVIELLQAKEGLLGLFEPALPQGNQGFGVCELRLDLFRAVITLRDELTGTPDCGARGLHLAQPGMVVRQCAKEGSKRRHLGAGCRLPERQDT